MTTRTRRRPFYTVARIFLVTPTTTLAFRALAETRRYSTPGRGRPPGLGAPGGRGASEGRADQRRVDTKQRAGSLGPGYHSATRQ